MWCNRGAAMVQLPRLGAVLGHGVGAATVGTDPQGHPQGHRVLPAVGMGDASGCWALVMGCTLQAAKHSAMSPTGAPALSWHHGCF